MMKKLIFAVGAGLGYVLGTRAGREKYEKMSAQARQVLDNPTVRDAKQAVASEAGRLYGEGRQRVQEKLRQIGDRNGRHHDGSLLDRTVSPATTDAPLRVAESGAWSTDRLGS